MTLIVSFFAPKAGSAAGDDRIYLGRWIHAEGAPRVGDIVLPPLYATEQATFIARWPVRRVEWPEEKHAYVIIGAPERVVDRDEVIHAARAVVEAAGHMHVTVCPIPAPLINALETALDALEQE